MAYIEEDVEYIKFIRDMKPTVSELQLMDIRRQYRLYRNKYFHDRKLPDVDHVSIIFVDRKEKSNVKGVKHPCMGMYLADNMPDFATIIIAKGMAYSVAMATLLHEMAHISVDIKFPGINMGHGNTWQNEMRRLARDGAFDNIW